MTKEPYLAHSELTYEIYIVSGRNKYLVTDQAVKAVKAIQALSQEPYDDAISREAVLEGLKGCICEEWIKTLFATMVKQLPSVTQKSGKWIEHPEIETNAPEYLMFYECSECRDKPCFCKSDIHKKRFCSNCGAKMVEPQERSE